tara:strand:+ start:212 stop:703 length:492 start_codon:yes stop_codon:yes gene_type:complete
VIKSGKKAEAEAEASNTEPRFSEDGKQPFVPENNPEFGEETKTLSVTLTPAGSPPFAPEGWDKKTESWPQPATEEQVMEWAFRIKEWARSHAREFSIEAIEYWAGRYYWDIFEEDFSRIRDILRTNLEPTSVDLQIAASDAEDEDNDSTESRVQQGPRRRKAG